MIHEILPVGMLQCNCSIFGDEAAREAIVIDPGDQIEDILAVLKRHKLTVKAIVITHAHIDHIGGAAKLKAATGAPVYMNANDQELYDHLDAQAAWLGVRTPERTTIDSAAREGGLAYAGRGIVPNHVPFPRYARPHSGQHLPLDSRGEQADCRRHPVPRQHREHRSAGRRLAPDPAFHSHQAADAAGDGGGDSGARPQHQHRARKGAQPVPTGVLNV